MSRVQLALNVSDLDEAIGFYSKLFGAEPAKVRPGYANFAIAEPPLEARAHRRRRPARLAEPSRRRGRLDRRGRRRANTPDRRGPVVRDRGPGRLLLRAPGQGLGRRARRRAVGDLHGARRRRTSRRPAAHGRAGRGRACAARARPSPRIAAAASGPRSRPARERRSRRHRAARRGRRRFRHRGPTHVAERRRPRAARERARDRRRARRAHPRVRFGVGRPFQPGGHARGSHPRWNDDPRRLRLRDRASPWWVRRLHGRERDVQPRRGQRLHPRPQFRRAVVLRGRRDVRAAHRDLRRRPQPGAPASRPSPSAPTSLPPIGLRPRRASRTRPSRSAARCRTRSPASRRRASRCSL